MSEFSKTDKTTITRLPKRGVYDKNVIYSILDEALVCTVAYVSEGQPMQIPTGFCRIENKLYIHGSVGSFYMRALAEKNLPVCISVTLLDGLVLARSAFHHSVNYRSVVLFSNAERVTDTAEGGPKDDEEDYQLPIWAGVVPLQTQRLTPVNDELLGAGIPLPDYLK